MQDLRCHPPAFPARHPRRATDRASARGRRVRAVSPLRADIWLRTKGRIHIELGRARAGEIAAGEVSWNLDRKTVHDQADPLDWQRSSSFRSVCIDAPGVDVIITLEHGQIAIHVRVGLVSDVLYGFAGHLGFGPDVGQFSHQEFLAAITCCSGRRTGHRLYNNE
jgi:hypothetical protein